MSKYLDENGLLYFWQKIKNTFATKSTATTSANGLMSSGDKTKLDGIETGANKTTVDSALSSTSSNPVQNSVINTALGNKVDKVSGKGLSTNDFTSALKTKLDGIASGAEVNVQSDWTATSGDAFIKNKPSIPSKVSDLTNDSGFTSNTGTITEVRGSDGLIGSGTSGSVTISHVTPIGADEIPSGLYKISTDYMGHVTGATAVAKSDITALGIPSTNTTYSAFGGATTSAAGSAGLVPAPSKLGTLSSYNSNVLKLLSSDGNWSNLEITNAATSDGKSRITAKIGSDVVDFTDLLVATTTANGVMSAADKAKLDAFGAASTYALKSDITSMYKHKGSVDTVALLPTTGNTTGDVYNVTATGMNYVWTGSAWDALGEVFTINSITNGEIDTIVAS